MVHYSQIMKVLAYSASGNLSIIVYQLEFGDKCTCSLILVMSYSWVQANHNFCIVVCHKKLQSYTVYLNYPDPLSTS